MKKNKTIIGKISLTTSTYNNNSTTNGNLSSTGYIANNLTYQSNPVLHKRAKSSNKLKTSKHRTNINIANVITQVSRQSNYNTTTNMNHTMNLFKQSRSLSPKMKQKFLLPPKMSNLKTLVLDLDETLVHSGFAPFDCPSDVIIQIELENEIHDIHVLVRPFVKEFLEKMSKHYELVVFTASLSKYANPLLNIIDQKGHCPFRLFREHCTLINTAFVKDLTRLGRDLKDIIIVDNSPVAYALNQDNGFPIQSWFNNKNDTELLKIVPILEFLSYVPDVREYIRKLVKNNQIQFNLVSSVISQYNNMLKKNQIPLSLRFRGTPLFAGLLSPKMKKSNSGKGGNLIKKVYIEEVMNKNNKKNKKKLNITNHEGSNKLTNSSTGVRIKNVLEVSKENNKISFLPSGIENINRINTMRYNSSTKKIVCLSSKEKSEHFQNSLRTKLKNFLYNTNTGASTTKNYHKKNTLSMSERMKNNLL